MPKIEIDGVSVEVAAGATIIEVADDLSIPIPRFCYHKKLSVAANCRMCLVHVDKAPKALPACATPVVDGMKVWTKSKEAVAAQRAVMEFLLINHPLDCPICDQGGECELQDVSMEYGQDDSRYTETKRSVLDHNLGPLIATEMTRCIHCTRCVRFGTEISGERELGATGRSEFMEIGTFIHGHMDSEVSGNVIDLCPVGALTSKPFRFKARAWELKQTPGISAHDCIGSNIYLHTRNQTIMRVVPKDSESINEVWLSDRDRFSYEGLLSSDRIGKPLMHKDTWDNVSWAEALKYTVAGLELIINKYSADQIGVLVSPSATNEEYYLLQKLMRSYGCNNIDHRMRQLDFKDQEIDSYLPSLGIKFADLENLDTVLLIGCNIAKEQPLASVRLHKMQKLGGKICAINAVDYQYNFPIYANEVVPAAQLLHTLAAVAKELITLTKYEAQAHIVKELENITITPATKKIAATLINSKKNQIILGHLATMHPKASTLFDLANLITQMIGGGYGSFSDGANSLGAWQLGCVPHRVPGGTTAKIGMNALQMLQTPLKCYVLFAIEPEFDSLLGAQALEMLRQADFVVVFSSYQSDTLLEIADIILPIAQFAERAGTMINIDGTVQHFSAVVPPFMDARPAWKVLRVLGNFSGFPDFEFDSLDLVTEQLQKYLKVESNLTNDKNISTLNIDNYVTNELVRIAPISLYAVDGMVRRAQSLQATKDAHLHAEIEVSENTAKNLNVLDNELVKVNAFGINDSSDVLKLKINNQVADFTAVIYQANAHTLNLGAPYTKLEVSKC